MTASNFLDQLSSIEPFGLLDAAQLKELAAEASLHNYTVGEKILRPGEINSNVYLLLSGSVRLLGTDFDNGGQLTLSKEKDGFFFGWVNILRGDPCEFVQASSPSTILVISSKTFLDIFRSHKDFQDYLNNKVSLQESYTVALSVLSLYPKYEKGWFKSILNLIQTSSVSTIEELNTKNQIPSNEKWFLSCPHVDNLPVGLRYDEFKSQKRPPETFTLPIRFVGFADSFDPSIETSPLKKGKQRT